MTDGSSTGGSPRRSADVDAVLAALTPEQRDALEDLRQAIGAAAPDAVETISYAVPAFKYRGRPLVSFGAGRKGRHLAFYVQSPAVMEAHRDELTGYDTSAGTIRFSADKPLPRELVTKLVRARMAETDAAAKR